MRIELTIKSDYVDWGLAAGLREILQNARDAALDTGEAPVVTYHPQRLELSIVSPGATLGREALLLGFTTKRGNEQYAGQFGEGLKLGTIGVLNAGRSIEFVTATERWIPCFVDSKQFPGQRVLAFDTSRRSPSLHARAAQVRVLVRGVLPGEWADVQRRVRWLLPVTTAIETTQGSILLDATRKGQIFVKGLLVEDLPTLHYGYDLVKVGVDRDRKMVDRTSAQSAIAQSWFDAVAVERETGAGTALRDKLFGLFVAEAPDVASAEWCWSIGHAADALADAFRQRHGDEAVACTPLELVAADDVGIEPVHRVVPSAGLYRVVTSTRASRPVPTVASFAQVKRERIQAEIAFDDLTETERAVFSTAVRRLRAAIPALREVPFAVAVLDDATRGLVRDGKIFIGRPELATVALAIRVGAHEAAHALGLSHHGASHHVAAEEILGAVLAQVLLELDAAKGGQS